MKKIFDSNNMLWQYPDGSGKETFELRLRMELLVDKAKCLGAEGKRSWHKEFKEINKWFGDREKSNAERS